MNDTPLTDSATFWGRDMGNDSATPHFKCVDADFARELERENAKLKTMKTLQEITQDEIDNLIKTRGHESAAWVGKYLMTIFELMAKGKIDEMQVGLEIADRLIKSPQFTANQTTQTK